MPDGDGALVPDGDGAGVPVGDGVRRRGVPVGAGFGALLPVGVGVGDGTGKDGGIQSGGLGEVVGCGCAEVFAAGAFRASGCADG